MYHLRFKGSHYEIGVKRGNIFNKCNIVFPLNMDSFQMKHGIESEIILRKYFPEVCDEVKGITDTINVEYKVFMSWLLAMGCCMYNIGSNHPEVRGCTAFCVCYKNKMYYGRNNDLPPMLKEGSKSEIYNINNKRFNITTSSFINGEEGMNDNNLVVSMTFVGTDLKDIKPGFNSVFIVRYLLEKATNVKEAIELLMPLPVASNCNIILADNTKDMCVVECTPRKKHIRKPIIISKDLQIICSVNSFIDLKEYEYYIGSTYKSSERYNNVLNAFKNYKDEDIIEYIKDILKGNHGFMCQYDKSLDFDTLWSSIFNITTKEVLRAEGNPRRNKYIIDNRLV